MNNLRGGEGDSLLSTVSEEHSYFEYGLSPSTSSRCTSGVKALVTDQTTLPLSKEEFEDLFRALKDNA